MRSVMIFLCLLTLVGVGMSSVSCSPKQEWTSSSNDAICEFEAGLESLMKLYSKEATQHFEKALELDPDFVAAKLVAAKYVEDKERREQLEKEIETAALDRLSDRERFMVRYSLARNDDRFDEAKTILKEYLKSYPEDPFGVERLAEDAWLRQDWGAAENAYKRLLEIDPNWVTAQNHLGYMAMAQGDFEGAEERFKAYRYVAPDQANPHDSMGELLTVVGRYEEALAELEHAIEIRADFCASYMHMLDVLVLDGRPYDGYRVLERAEENCPANYAKRISIARCQLAFWADYLDGDFDAPWRDERQECTKQVGARGFLIHRMASLSGRWEEAIALEEEVAEYIETRGSSSEIESKTVQGVFGHLRGVRLLAQGDADAAVESMREADDVLYYWGQDQGILKLFNRLNLSSALESAGRDEDAAAVLAKVRKVNARFADAYPEIKDGSSSE
jgi:tetratricopeptide (TPR) repeat protein